MEATRAGALALVVLSLSALAAAPVDAHEIDGDPSHEQAVKITVLTEKSRVEVGEKFTIRARVSANPDVETQPGRYIIAIQENDNSNKKQREFSFGPGQTREFTYTSSYDKYYDMGGKPKVRVVGPGMEHQEIETGGPDPIKPDGYRDDQEKSNSGYLLLWGTVLGMFGLGLVMGYKRYIDS